ncbi:nucleotide exchange factor GrpE [Actinoplanes sp. NBC_00393]|uniref:nucleotide exchange factor GrpE n=1 Tax=Actinoplanes sp. NBC_00393 TaxID=2975953 RepID=UPI002E1B0379
MTSDPPEVFAALERIDGRLAGLHQLFENKISDDQQHREWSEHLMTELTNYRDDWLRRHMLSRVLRDLIQLHDTVEQTLQACALGAASAEILQARLRSLREQLVQALQRQDVSPISSGVGTPFDEAVQEAIEVRPTADAALDGAVVEVVRLGFRDGRRVLRPESVVVGRYGPSDGVRDE